MALLAAGRRLPVLRDLTVLAARPDSAFHGSFNLLNTLFSSKSEVTDSNSIAPSNKPATGNTGSGIPVESAQPPSEPHPQAVETNSPVASAGSESTSQPTPVEDDDEWTEVVHSSGQVYYWNQRTGQTTQLGEPKPESGRGGRRGAGGGGASGGGASGGGGATGANEDIRDPRAEAPLDDRTGTYAGMGVIIGAFLGWVSQFV